MKNLWSIKNICRILGITLTILAIYILVVIYDSDYSFSIDTVKHDTLCRLNQLAKKVEQIRHWKPVSFEEAHIQLLSKWITFDEYKYIEKPQEMIFRTNERSGKNSQAMNSLLSFLSYSDNCNIRKLSAMSEIKRKQSLKDIIEEIILEEKEKAYYAVLNLEKNLLAQIGIPLPPKISSFDKWIRRIFGKKNDALERYTSSLLKENAKLHPIYDLYMALDKHEELILENNIPAFSLMLRKIKYVNPNNYAIKYDGKKSTIDMAFWLRKQIDGMTISKEEDTGIRLLGIQAYLDNQSNLAYKWETTSIYLDTAQFAEFLHILGISKAFYFQDVKIQNWKFSSANQISLDVSFKVYHKAIDDSLMSANLVFGSDCTTTTILAISNLQKFLVEELQNSLIKQKTFNNITLLETKKNNNEIQTIFDINKIAINASFSITQNCEVNPILVISESTQEKILATILEAYLELKDCQELIRIQNVQVGYNPSRIFGTLSILGRNIGHSKNFYDVSWGISVGQATVASSAELKAYLVDLKKYKQPSDKKSIENIRNTIFHYLNSYHRNIKNFLKLSFIKDTEYGILISFSLQIADWPQIEIGPIRYDDNFNLEQIISSHTIIDYTNRQWKDTIQHPRYGKIKSQLTSLNLLYETTSISCSIPFNVYADVLKLTWNEKLKIADPPPTSQNIELMCQMLYPGIDLLQQQLSQTLKNTTSLEISFELDKHAFGRNQWLSLKPFSLYFNLSFSIPHLSAIKVVCQRILLDQDGLHFSDVYKFIYHRTYPFAYIAVSDPAIELDIPNKSLGVEAKITPTTGISTLIYNPWIPYIFLAANLKASFQEVALQMNTDLVVLEEYNLAKGHTEANFEKNFFIVSLKAGQQDFPAKFSGDFYIGKEGLKIATQADILGFSLDGCGKYDLDQKEIALAAKTIIPIVGYCDIFGKSDLKFDRKYGDAEGVIDLIFCCFGFNFHVDNDTWYIKFKSLKTYKTYTFEGPRAEYFEAHQKEFLAKLEEYEKSEARSLSKNAEASLQEAFPEENNSLAETLTSHKPNHLPDIMLASQKSGEKSDAKIVLPKGNLEVEEKNGYLRCFTVDEKGKEMEYVYVPVSSLGGINHKHCGVGIWYDDKNVVAVTIYDYKNRNIYAAKIFNKTKVENFWDITKDIPEFNFPSEGMSDKDLQDVHTYFDMLMYYTKHKVWPPEANNIVKKNNSIYSFDVGTEAKSTTEFFWNNDNGCYFGFIPKDRKVDNNIIYEALPQISPSSKIALFWSLKSCPNSPIGMLDLSLTQSVNFNFYVDIKEPNKNTPIKLESFSETSFYLFETLEYLLELYINKNDLSKVKCFIGDSGIFVYNDEHFYVVNAQELEAKDKEIHADNIHTGTWSIFHQWPNETRRFLPEYLDSSNKRKNTPKEELAKHIVITFAKSRKEGWAVSPIGLMIGLTNGKK